MRITIVSDKFCQPLENTIFMLPEPVHAALKLHAWLNRTHFHPRWKKKEMPAFLSALPFSNLISLSSTFLENLTHPLHVPNRQSLGMSQGHVLPISKV